MKIAPQAERAEGLKQLEQRWTRGLIAPGWTALPSVIIERQQALGLDAVDLNILLHLTRFWWHKDNLPHPSKATIAASMGVDVSTVRRRVARLENDGLIQRVARFNPASGRQQTNSYRFDGLIKAAAPFAKEALEDKERRKSEAAARLRRKRPALSVVRNEG